MLEALIFDIGDVLVEVSPKRLFAKMGASETECAYLEAMVFNASWRQEHDRGRFFTEGIDILLKERPEKYHPFIRAYKTNWDEMLVPVPDAIEILERLHHKNYDLYAASNWSTETFSCLRRAVPAIGIFKGVQISGAIGITKPDATFFEIMIESFQINPKNALFIDDSVKNVEAALSCGLASIVYENPQQLRHELRIHGIDCT